MQYGASAYAKTARATTSPRDLEASILMKAATRLQGVKDNWEALRGDLDEALTYNRKLWVILSTSATSADNPLPKAIKESIGSLGVFVFKHTISVLANPAPERLAILININRDIAAGLRGR
ncbi:flagellar biosynthesis regulator FlaF [Bosea sp. (in: a-proteobacteria)]|uniref:flagellar biosynthesis regulator FlaF n=1 Tax=Bosea sp. (in: a-proteobacteria) TaxID=1871050 RepID=UPI002633BEBA|nr:flagellar biosynthesis regulator FlaF [Bosea sp. (in: a-proteobacteria)]MCO5092128.1 flagellar biosynthesis regulator FlaF [Bosea sp. (in: a-proteobacteria)]